MCCRLDPTKVETGRMGNKTSDIFYSYTLFVLQFVYTKKVILTEVILFSSHSRVAYLGIGTKHLLAVKKMGLCLYLYQRLFCTMVPEKNVLVGNSNGWVIVLNVNQTNFGEAGYWLEVHRRGEYKSFVT